MPLDPPGTCHLVGCPTKGTHDVHTRPIGCPDTFEPYDVPSTPAKVLLEQEDVAWLLDKVAGDARPDQLPHRLHRISRALAVARNTTRTIPPTSKEAV